MKVLVWLLALSVGTSLAEPSVMDVIGMEVPTTITKGDEATTNYVLALVAVLATVGFAWALRGYVGQLIQARTADREVTLLLDKTRQALEANRDMCDRVFHSLEHLDDELKRRKGP